MPPRFEPPDEDEIMRQAKRLQRMAGGLSNRTVITATLGSAFAGICALLWAAWFVANKTRDYDEELRDISNKLVALTAEVRNGNDRWKLKHEAEIWADFERRNRMLKLDIPDPYATKLKIGD